MFHKDHWERGLKLGGWRGIDPMRRRDFLTFVCGAFAWPLGARAQAPAMPVIGFLNTASPQPFAQLVAAFQKGLNDTGYVDGRNVRIDYRWAEGDEDRLKAHASDLVRRQVAVIAATGGIRSAQTAKDATATIPVLFISGFNPVQLGFVASINRPGGNLTGVSVDTTDMFPKRLELLRELVPGEAKVAMLVGLGRYIPDLETKFAERNGLLAFSVSNESGFDSAFDRVAKQGARALLVGADPMYFDRRDLIVALAARHGLPAVFPLRTYAAVGGLASYGPNIADAYRQIGVYAGRILKGAKPDDLPVVFPRQWELVINLKTAKALGLAISPLLLARADEAIE
jgi:putative tryptophan/tyrosine transport system substrate-binding protein